MAAGPITSLGTQIEKNCAPETAFAHARNVEVAVGVPRAKIEPAGRDQALRGVSVCVDDDRGGVDASCLLRHHHGAGPGSGAAARVTSRKKEVSNDMVSACHFRPTDS